MKLSQLLAALPRYNFSDLFSQQQTKKNLSIDITNITSDSRQVTPGDLFVAYRGVNVDLHRFIPEAIARGAAAIVCEDEKLVPSSLLPTLSNASRSHSPLPTIIVPCGREALAYLSAAWHNFPARRLTAVRCVNVIGQGDCGLVGLRSQAAFFRTPSEILTEAKGNGRAVP